MKCDESVELKDWTEKTFVKENPGFCVKVRTKKLKYHVFTGAWRSLYMQET